MNEHQNAIDSGQRFARRIFATVVLLMILFPPIYRTSEHGMYFRGYDFITELSRSYYFVEWSRLGLQFAALGLLWFFYIEITSISGKEEENISSTSKVETPTHKKAQIPSWLKKLYRP